MKVYVLGKVIDIKTKEELVAIFAANARREFQVENIIYDNENEFRDFIANFSELMDLVEQFPAYYSLLLTTYASQVVNVNQPNFQLIVSNAAKKRSLGLRLACAIQLFPELILTQNDLKLFLEKFPEQGRNILRTFQRAPYFSNIICPKSTGVENFLALIKCFPDHEAINLINRLVASPQFNELVYDYVRVMKVCLAYPDIASQLIEAFAFHRGVFLLSGEKIKLTPPDCAPLIRLLEYFPRLCDKPTDILCAIKYFNQQHPNESQQVVNFLKERLFAQMKNIEMEELPSLCEQFPEHADFFAEVYLEKMIPSKRVQEIEVEITRDDSLSTGAEYVNKVLEKNREDKRDLSLLCALQVMLNASDNFLSQILNAWIVNSSDGSLIKTKSFFGRDHLVKSVLEVLQYTLNPDYESSRIALGTASEHVDAILFLHEHFPEQFDDESLNKALKFWIEFYFCRSNNYHKCVSQRLNNLINKLRFIEQPYKDRIILILKNEKSIFDRLIIENMDKLIYSDNDPDVGPVLLALKAKIYVDSCAHLEEALGGILSLGQETNKKVEGEKTHSSILRGGIKQVIAILEYISEKLKYALANPGLTMGGKCKMDKEYFKNLYRMIVQVQAHLNFLYDDPKFSEIMETIVSRLEAFIMPSLCTLSMRTINQHMGIFAGRLQELPPEIQERLNGIQTPIYQDLPENDVVAMQSTSGSSNEVLKP